MPFRIGGLTECPDYGYPDKPDFTVPTCTTIQQYNINYMAV